MNQSEQQRLDRIEQRLERATPGPWRRYSAITRAGFTWGENDIRASGERASVVKWEAFDDIDRPKYQHRANAIFIAHAPGDMRTLIDMYRALRRRSVPQPVTEQQHEDDLVTAREDAREMHDLKQRIQELRELVKDFQTHTINSFQRASSYDREEGFRQFCSYCESIFSVDEPATHDDKCVVPGLLERAEQLLQPKDVGLATKDGEA